MANFFSSLCITECINCRQQSANRLCPHCLKVLKFNQLVFNTHCFMCHQTSTHFAQTLSIHCSRCLMKTWLSDVISLFINRTSVAALLTYAKRSGSYRSLDTLFHHLHPSSALNLLRLSETIDLILISPTSFSRYMQSGIILPWMIAHQLFPYARSKIVYCFNKKNFQQQKLKSWVERKHIPEDTFGWMKSSASHPLIFQNLAGGKKPFSNLNCLIVDDIATTGATIQQLAWLTKQLGAKTIFGLVLAITPIIKDSRQPTTMSK